MFAHLNLQECELLVKSMFIVKMFLIINLKGDS